MKFLLWVIGVPLVLLLLAVVLLPVLVNEEALIELAAEKIEAQSGVRIAVSGDASLSLFPRVALSTSDVSIQLPDDGARIEADYLQAGVALMPLLRRSVEMDSITIDGLTVTQVANDATAAKTAELDTSTMSPQELDAFYAARAAARDDAASKLAGEALAAPLALEVGELSLRNIRARTVDDNGELISEFELKYLTASDLNTAGRAIPLTASIVLPGETPEDSIEVTIEGSAALEGNSATLADISIIVEGATPDPVLLSASGEAALDTGIANLELALSIGSLSGEGTVRYASYESPMIDAVLSLTELNPALLILAGPEAVEAAAKSDSVDSDGDMPLPLHALRMIDTRAQLSIETVVLNAHRLENVQAQLRINDGIATLSPVTATVHGGEIAFEMVLNGRYNTAQMRTEGAVTALDVGQAVSAMEVGVAASGSADLTWSLTSSGKSSGELTQSLNGPIDFTTADITLQGFAMEEMFCRAIAFVNQGSLTAEFPVDTQFDALSAKIQLTNGVATLDPLTAALPAVSLGGTGIVNLDSQDLQASFRAQISPELGELDPACRINERYAELRWPVECRGSLAGDPAEWCDVNTTEIVKDLAESEVKRKVGQEAGRFLKKLLR